MASSSDVKAGGAYVELYVKDLISKGLQQVESQLKSWAAGIGKIGATLAAIGALVTAPILYGLSTLSEWAGDMRRTMRETGLTYAELDTLMDGMRVKSDELVPAVAKMGAFLMEAANGGRAANDALAKLGLTIDELSRMTVGERMLAIADALNKVGDASQRVALQRQIFGRGGLALNIEGGRAGILARDQRAAELQGPTLKSEETLNMAFAYKRALSEMKMATEGFWASLGAAIIPTMTTFTQRLTDAIVWVRKFVDDNREMVLTVFQVAGGIAGAGSALMVFAGLLYGMATAIGFARAILTGTLTAMNVARVATMATLGALNVLNWLYVAVINAASIGTLIFAAAEAVATGGATALLAVLGAVVTVLGGFVGAGLLIGGVALAVQALGLQFGDLHSSLSVVDDLIDGIVSAAASVWDWIADSPIGEFGRYVMGVWDAIWGSITGAIDSIGKFLDESGLGDFLQTLLNIGLGIAGVTAGLIAFAAYGAKLAYDWVTTPKNIATAWEVLKATFLGATASVIALGDIASWLADKWIDGINIINEGLEDVFSPIIGVGKAVRTIGAQFITTLQSMGSTVSAAAGRIVDGFRGAWSQTMAGFSEMFGSIVGMASGAWSGVMSAFRAGDMSLMWDILRTGGKIAWEELSYFAMTTFTHWKDFIVDTFMDVWGTLKDLFSQGWAFVSAGWHTLMAALLRGLKDPIEMIGQMAIAFAAVTGNEAAERLGNRLIGMNPEAAARTHERQAIGASESSEAEQEFAAMAAHNEAYFRSLERDARDREREGAHRAEADDLGVIFQRHLDRAREQETTRNNAPKPPDQRGPAGFDVTAKGSVFGSFSASAFQGSFGQRTESQEMSRRQQEANRIAQQILEAVKNIPPMVFG